MKPEDAQPPAPPAGLAAIRDLTPKMETRPVSPAVRALWLHTEALLGMLQQSVANASAQTDGIGASEGWTLNAQAMQWERPVPTVPKA